MNTRNRVDINGDKIEFRLTFEQWCDIWQQSGKWDQRGSNKDGYVMSRYNDIGHYEVGNVYITKHILNASESSKRGNSGNFKPGHIFSEETRKKLIQAKTGKTRPKGICPYCKKEGAIALLKRYHFDNCKFK